MQNKILRKGLIVGIVFIFIGMSLIQTVASTHDKTIEIKEMISNKNSNNISWTYFLFGRIKNYEIVEYEDKEYILGRTIFVRGFVWNVFPDLDFPLPAIWIYETFCIPLEGAIIMGPTKYLGHYFFLAKGEL
ncbi:hypothetical protein AYK24_04545 [Thermoplasmatales archaeon SG8-52-4]|nr:MAG: hypothetical protein AYK24_04545 [Thermoplasmatales archaeon SG8-52-4]